MAEMNRRTKKKVKPLFDELRDWLSVANSDHDIKTALERFAARYGFSWFTYLAVNDTNVRGLSNYSLDWQERYLADHLAVIDPILAVARSAKRPFSWSAGSVTPGWTRQQIRFMRDAEAVGIRSGVSIPILDGYGIRAVATFSGSESEIDREIVADEFDLLAIGAYLHAFLARRDDIALHAAKCPLTHSQLECLSWLVQGKNNTDVASIRGISTRAVEYQLQAIRHKLGASTTVQAAAIALDRRWVSL
jgi:LuxR family transcriptional regulator, activator of conjugal transfer of Ti plasmids